MHRHRRGRRHGELPTGPGDYLAWKRDARQYHAEISRRKISRTLTHPSKFPEGPGRLMEDSQMKTRKRYSTWMKICSRLFVILPLLAPTLAAADDSCGDFKRALEALDASRSVRKYAFSMWNTLEDTMEIAEDMPESEQRRIFGNAFDFLADLDTAYHAANSDYGDANSFAYDAALHAASSAGISNDKSIQSVIALGGTTLRLIGAIIPSDGETFVPSDGTATIPLRLMVREIGEREEKLDTQDSIFSSFLE